MRDLLFVLAAAALNIAACECVHRTKATAAKCSWASPFKNTLQHDIHRRWVCR